MNQEIKKKIEEKYPIPPTNLFGAEVAKAKRLAAEFGYQLAQEEMKDGWISVNDALPPFGERKGVSENVEIKFYIEGDEKTVMQSKAHIFHTHWVSESGIEPDPLAVVTHWRKIK